MCMKLCHALLGDVPPLLTVCRTCQVAPGLGIDVTNVDTGDIECALIAMCAG